MAIKSDTGANVLVTGASGGIGEAFVDLLAGRQRRLVIVARNEEELNRVAAVTSTRHSAQITAIAMDLSKPGAGAALERDLKRRRFSPDVVINNAGFGLNGAALELPAAEQVNMIDLNVRTLADLTLRFLPAMVDRDRGGVLNVASVASFFPAPYMATYHATKAFVLSFSEAMSAELTSPNVSITALCPGPVATGFQSRADMADVRGIKLSNPASAEQTALAGWEAFERGERIVIPGASNKFFVQLARVLPRSALFSMMRYLYQTGKTP